MNYNLEMNIRGEIKSIIAKKATTLKAVCEKFEKYENKKLSPNNLTNKLRRNTIKFKEVEDILNILGYHIEFIENK